jgi:hypothetical protein
VREELDAILTEFDAILTEFDAILTVTALNETPVLTKLT